MTNQNYQTSAPASYVQFQQQPIQSLADLAAWRQQQVIRQQVVVEDAVAGVQVAGYLAPCVSLLPAPRIPVVAAPAPVRPVYRPTTKRGGGWISGSALRRLLVRSVTSWKQPAPRPEVEVFEWVM